MAKAKHPLDEQFRTGREIARKILWVAKLTTALVDGRLGDQLTKSDIEYLDRVRQDLANMALRYDRNIEGRT